MILSRPEALPDILDRDTTTKWSRLANRRLRIAPPCVVTLHDWRDPRLGVHPYDERTERSETTREASQSCYSRMSADPCHEKGNALPLHMLPLVAKRLPGSEFELNGAQQCPQKMDSDAGCGTLCQCGPVRVTGA